MLASAAKAAYWDSLAESYRSLGSPFRPISEDVRIYEKAVADWAAERPRGAVQGLVLGSTPALAGLGWPTGTQLISVDNSFSMVRSVWPAADRRPGICGSWTDLPLRDHSIDVAVGDGSLNCVRHPEPVETVCRSLSRALSPDGLFLLRTYVRPEEPESVEQVFEDMFRGAIPSLTHFKLRLFLAMPQDRRSGAALEDFYELWLEHVIDPACIAQATGWPLEDIQTLSAYRQSSTVHTFPTLAEFRGLLHRHFDECAIVTPNYLLGEHCPIFVLRPR